MGSKMLLRCSTLVSSIVLYSPGESFSVSEHISIHGNVEAKDDVMQCANSEVMQLQKVMQ